MRENPVYQLTVSKVRELLRTPEAVFWIFVFPLVLTGVLGIAFRTKGPEVVPVGVQDGAGAEETRLLLDAVEELGAEVLAEDRAQRALARGEVALVVIPGDPATYWFDPTRPESRLARALVDEAIQGAAGRSDPVRVSSRELTERGSRYIDFLVPGLIGMNIMGTGLWGVGFSIVAARVRKVLKRFVATPMRRSHYLIAQMLGRLVFLVLEVGALLLFARFVFDVPIRGSVIGLMAVAFLGAMVFAGIGLLVGSRTRTIEGISGLVNLVVFPMWVLSGIFFSTERFPDIMQPVVQALPLTAINDALRAVMLDGASVASQAGEMAIAGAWGLVAFVVALRIFRWN